MLTTPPTVATTSTLAMLRAAESRGCETGDLLAAAGLERGVVEDPDARIPAPRALALWAALQERSGDPALQLRAPTVLPFGAYRVIDYLVGASATVGEGVERFARFFRLIADAVCLTVDTEGDERRLCLRRADGGPAPGPYVDYVFAALVGRIRMRIRPELRVLRVELRHAAPSDPTPWASCFDAPVAFDREADRLCFAREEWEAAIEHADAALAHLLEEHARMLWARLPETTDPCVEAVREVLARGLAEEVTAERVARALHVSVRTLQRKLRAAGTSLRDLTDATRRGLAEGYLMDPGVSIAEVSFLLGFSDQTSFTRAFRRWTGRSPGAWRRRGAIRSAGEIG